MVHFIFIAPMHSYVTNVLVYNLHITIVVCTRMLLVCARMLFVCTRMLLAYHSCVVLLTINLTLINILHTKFLYFTSPQARRHSFS